MSIVNVDRTLPSNTMVFELRREPEKYAMFKANLEAAMEHYGLTAPEREAWRDMNIAALAKMGVHPYFLPQISRLFKGGQYNHNNSDAARLYAEKMGITEGER